MRSTRCCITQAPVEGLRANITHRASRSSVRQGSGPSAQRAVCISSAINTLPYPRQTEMPISSCAIRQSNSTVATAASTSHFMRPNLSKPAWAIMRHNRGSALSEGFPEVLIGGRWAFDPIEDRKHRRAGGVSFHSEWGSSGQTNADIWINIHSHREAFR